MKKVFYAVLAAAAAFATASCCGNSQPDLEGVWDITSVSGEQIALADSLSEAAPFIEFNVAESQFHGNTGCNIMNGEYTFTGDSLSFSPAATTMMAGPQELMDLESKVLNAISNAATVNAVEAEKVQVLDAEGNVLMELTKRAAVAEPAAEAADTTSACCDSAACCDSTDACDSAATCCNPAAETAAE